MHFLFWFENITFDPSIHTMDHSQLTVSNFMENSNALKKVKNEKQLTLKLQLAKLTTHCFARK